jgi:hypothetical protein
LEAKKIFKKSVGWFSDEFLRIQAQTRSLFRHGAVTKVFLGNILVRISIFSTNICTLFCIFGVSDTPHDGGGKIGSLGQRCGKKAQPKPRPEIRPISELPEVCNDLFNLRTAYANKSFGSEELKRPGGWFRERRKKRRIDKCGGKRQRAIYTSLVIAPGKPRVYTRKG